MRCSYNGKGGLLIVGLTVNKLKESTDYQYIKISHFNGDESLLKIFYSTIKNKLLF